MNSTFENILVTGGAGFIGSHLARALINAGHCVTSLDLRGNPEEPVLGVDYVQGDARNLETIRSLLRRARITTLYHLAATVSVPLCQNDVIQSYSHNVTSTLMALEACRLNSTPVRFAFSSSAALYGNLGDDRVPLTEGRIAQRFSSFYAAQKHASEKMIELYHSFHAIPTLTFRFFNVYGHGQDPSSPYSGVITIFSKLAKEQKDIVLHNAGVQTRDFIPVSEIVKAAVGILDLPQEKWNSCVINLGSGVPTSIRELAETIRTLAASKSPIVEGPPRDGDVLHSLADLSFAREFLKLPVSPDLAVKLCELLNA